MKNNRTNGFLLIDADKNTLIITRDDYNSGKSFEEIISKNIGYIRKHEKQADLIEDVRIYFRGGYTR